MNLSASTATNLEILNQERASNNIPVIIYVGMMSIIGSIGNIHVILVYALAIKLSTNFRIFVLFLACIDVFGCIAVMPFEIYVLLNEYMFFNLTACRIFSFIKPLMIIASGTMFFVIALERYLKCSAYGWQMTTRHATIACILALTLSLILTWPSPMLKGNATKNLTDGVQGIQCEIQDKLKGTVYPIVYYGILFVVYFAATVSVIVLYCLIGRRLREHAELKKKKFLGMQRKPSDQKNIVSDSEKSSGVEKIETENSSKEPKEQLKIGKKEMKMKVWDTTTKILFVITMVFMITFLPHLILVPLLILSRSFRNGLGPVTWPIYKIFRRLFFVNQIANPFIYAFFDREFRNCCINFYKNVFCRKKEE